MNSTTEAKKILSEFNKNNIKYCVLRNYGILLKNKGKVGSIDMAISNNDFKKAEEIFKRSNFIKRPKTFTKIHQGFQKYLPKTGEILGFDTQKGCISWNDIPYLNEDIFNRRIKYKNFYILSPEDEFSMLIIHSIVGKRYFKPEYKEIISKLMTCKNSDLVKKTLKKAFGKKYKNIINLIEKFHELIKIKNRLILRFIVKKPLTFFSTFIRWFIWKLPKRKPTIAFIGPDGSGKSTMTSKLINALEAVSKRTKLVYFGRGKQNIIPFTKIGRAYKKIEQKRESKKQPSPYKKILYTLAAPIFTLDLLLRYLFFIFPKRFNKIIITDRYCSDIMLMEHVPESFRKFLLSLFPKPSMLFYLYNDPEIIYPRRKKQPVEDLKRQMDELEKISHKFKGFKIKSDNIQNTYSKIQEITFNYLIKKGF